MNLADGLKVVLVSVLTITVFPAWPASACVRRMVEAPVIVGIILPLWPFSITFFKLVSNCATEPLAKNVFVTKFSERSAEYSTDWPSVEIKVIVLFGFVVDGKPVNPISTVATEPVAIKPPAGTVAPVRLQFIKDLSSFVNTG